MRSFGNNPTQVPSSHPKNYLYSLNQSLTENCLLHLSIPPHKKNSHFPSKRCPAAASMEPISLSPLVTISLLPSSSSPQKPKLQFPSNIKSLALKKLQSFSNGGLPSSSKLFGQDLLCSSSIGSMLMNTSAAVSVSKAKVSPFLWTLAGNPTFVSGLIAWVLAQSMKVFLNFFVEKRWDFAMLVNSGGMPSSHSALCTALTTSVAFCHGVGDSLFPVCLGFSLIVMYDAIGVRRHAGMQAEVLNKIIEDLFQGHPISQRKLKELLGHTPSQVIAGAFLGILVACVCCQGVVAI